MKGKAKDLEAKEKGSKVSRETMEEGGILEDGIARADS